MSGQPKNVQEQVRGQQLNDGSKSNDLNDEQRSLWQRAGELNTRCALLWVYMILLTLLGGAAIYYVDGKAQRDTVSGKLDVKVNEFIDIYCKVQTCPNETPTIFRDQVREGIVNSTATPAKWLFTTAMFYCTTLYTTIGYGHIAAISPAAKVITVVYAIIGIPSFLLMLEASGKVLTRIIKYICVKVRDAYYKGSLKTFRKWPPIRYFLRGMKRTYQVITCQKATATADEEPEIVVNDNFDLPIKLAISIWVVYMICGGFLFHTWETDWGLFNSFYFVFISLSTIGLGDVVPSHPRFTMLAFPYLIIGFALTAMCINVIQLRIKEGEKIIADGVEETLNTVEVLGESIQHSVEAICESIQGIVSGDDDEDDKPTDVKTNNNNCIMK